LATSALSNRSGPSSGRSSQTCDAVTPGVAIAETGHLDLHRRAEIGIAVVSDTAGNATSLLEECERLVAAHPEIELLSARQRLFTEEE